MTPESDGDSKGDTGGKDDGLGGDSTAREPGAAGPESKVGDAKPVSTTVKMDTNVTVTAVFAQEKT
jgi:hypothetical protein